MYTILRTYADGTRFSDTADNIIQIFGACAIYADVTDLVSLTVWNNKTGAIVIAYNPGT